MGRRPQVFRPIPWEGDQIDRSRDAVVQVYAEFQRGLEHGGAAHLQTLSTAVPELEAVKGTTPRSAAPRR